jgi:predicted PurR-regulated permease PerM
MPESPAGVLPSFEPAPVPPVPPPGDPSARIARILRAACIIVVVAALLWVMADAFLLIFLAILVAAMLRGLGKDLTRRTGLPVTPAVLVVFVVLLALIAAAGYWIGPKLAAQTEQLWRELANQAGALQQTMHDLGLGSVIGSSTGELPHVVTLVASSALGFIVAIVVIAATAVYFAIAPEMYIDGAVRLVPLWYRARAREIILEMGASLQSWLVGQLIDMVVVGVLVGGGLALLGVPLAMVLGVIAGLFTFVPYFGTIASMVPAVLVGLTQGLRQTLWIVLLFVVAHGVEGYVVSPFVQRHTVHLPPALTVLAMVVLTAVFGSSGVLIATPLVAVLMVGVTRVYVEDILGDRGAARATTTRTGWYWFTPRGETGPPSPWA